MRGIISPFVTPLFPGKCVASEPVKEARSEERERDPVDLCACFDGLWLSTTVGQFGKKMI